MLNLKDRSALENYYLLKKLPEYTHIVDHSKDIIKDQKYYSTKIKENIWENERRLSPKYLRQYHEINEQHKDKITFMNEMQVEEKREKEKYQKSQVNSSRIEGMQRLQSRKLERISTEFESKQLLTSSSFRDQSELSETEESKKKRIMRKIFNRSHIIEGKTPFKWNDLSNSCDKYVQQAINSRIIQKDNEAFVSIQKRIDKDNHDEQLRNSLVKQNINQIRNNFLEVQKNNYEKEKRIHHKMRSLHLNQQVIVISPDKKTEEVKAKEKLKLEKQEREKKLREFEEKEDLLKASQSVQYEKEVIICNNDNSFPQIGLLSQNSQRIFRMGSKELISSKEPTNSQINNYLIQSENHKSKLQFDDQNSNYNTNAEREFQEYYSDPKQQSTQRKAVCFKINDTNEKFKKSKDQDHNFSSNQNNQKINLRYLSDNVKSSDIFPDTINSNAYSSLPVKNHVKPQCSRSKVPLDEVELKREHQNHHLGSSSPQIYKRYSRNSSKPQTNEKINELSQPKFNFNFYPTVEQLADKEEFRGLLCTSISKFDTLITNPLVKTIVTNSNIAKNLYNTKSRSFSKQGSIYSKEGSHKDELFYSTAAILTPSQTNLSTSHFIASANHQENKRKQYLEEMDSFDQTEKPINNAFPGKTLNEFRNSIQNTQKFVKKNGSHHRNSINTQSIVGNSQIQRRRVNSLHQAGQYQQNKQF